MAVPAPNGRRNTQALLQEIGDRIQVNREDDGQKDHKQNIDRAD